MSEQLSREVALRIGLAARELPDTDPKRLIEVLVACVDLPLTEKKLAKLKIKDLKTAADGELAEISGDMLKKALKYLQSTQLEDEISDSLPPIQPYTEGDMPGSIRVAVASNTEDELDGHFGSCARFLIYQVAKDEQRLVEIRPTIATDEALDDKNAYRAQLIEDCHVLYVVSIGGPAAAKVVKAQIHPIKVPQGGQAPELVAKLQEILQGHPPPWLAKVMGVAASERTPFSGTEEDDA